MTIFVSRNQWGARAPRSVSTNITPKGVAIHWGGTAVNADPHSRCAEIVRNWQNYHMDRLGWSDIAYSLLCCQHDHVFAGRGAGIRTAANGTNEGNQSYYAACGLIGGGETPTDAMLDAFGWAVRELRRSGAGSEIVPHSFFKPTQCPGPLESRIGEIAERARTTREEDMPLTDEDARKVAAAVWHFGMPSAASFTGDRQWAESFLRSAARDASALRGALNHDALVAAVRDALGGRGVELSDEDILRIVDATIAEIAS